MTSEALRFTEEPQLRDPVLIMAFSGWNDAADSATGALKYLTRKLSANKFAELDPEDFYDFTETRPQVRLTRSVQRRIRWPANDFFYALDPAQPRDFILMNGVEPNLKWRTYSSIILDVSKKYHVSSVILLGGLIADVPHTKPVRVTGTSADPELSQRLEGMHLRGSRYEGPTGIVGILSDRFRRERIPCASLWATVPHYISTSNPRASQALLTRLGSLLDLRLSLGDIEREATEFDRQVSQAVARDPDVAAYVRQLEESDSGELETAPEHSELPTGETVVRELEEFLRRSRDDSPSA